MASVFARIISGELPACKVAEDDRFLAFLDVNPNAIGHTLCIPKQEIDKVFDLDQETFTALMAFARKVAIALEKAVPCRRIGMAAVGLEVPHAHIHLIPLHDMDDMRFERKVRLSDAEMRETAEKIASFL